MLYSSFFFLFVALIVLGSVCLGWDSSPLGAGRVPVVALPVSFCSLPFSKLSGMHPHSTILTGPDLGRVLF